MKEIKLQINGTEITAQVSEDELAKLMNRSFVFDHSGYERCETGESYYYIDSFGSCRCAELTFRYQRKYSSRSQK